MRPSTLNRSRSKITHAMMFQRSWANELLVKWPNWSCKGFKWSICKKRPGLPHSFLGKQSPFNTAYGLVKKMWQFYYVFFYNWWWSLRCIICISVLREHELIEIIVYLLSLCSSLRVLLYQVRGPSRVFGRLKIMVSYVWRKWRHNFWQSEEMKTEGFSKFSTCEDWRMKTSRKCEP